MPDSSELNERTYRLRVQEVHRLIKERGLTPARLARKVEIDPKTLARKLKGEPMFVRNIKVLADHLGTLPSELIEIVQPCEQESTRVCNEFKGTVDLYIRLSATITDPRIAASLKSIIDNAIEKITEQGAIVTLNDTSIRVTQTIEEDDSVFFLVFKYDMADHLENWICGKIMSKMENIFRRMIDFEDVQLDDFGSLGTVTARGQGEWDGLSSLPSPDKNLKSIVATLKPRAPEALDWCI